MEYIVHVLCLVGIFAILSLSLNLVVGYTGLPSLGHAAFFGIGAYASALTVVDLHYSPWLGLIAGAGLAAAMGWVIAQPTLRLGGDYLALATFGSGVIIYSVFRNWEEVTRGPLGIPGIPNLSLFGYSLATPAAYLPLVLAFVLLTYLMLHRIVHSPLGRVIRSIREDETVVLAVGKKVNRYKVQVFVIGSAFAGLAGSLYAHYITFIDPTSFTSTESITILLMVILGGMGSLEGSLLGAGVLIGVPEIFRFLGIPGSVVGPVRQILYGFLLVWLMRVRPQGLLGRYVWK